MSETKWTPGPWAVADGEVHHKGYLVITAKGMGSHTPLARIGGADWDDASRSDAHLIAAAPDLYAALEDLCRSGGPDDGGDVFERAYAALRKARGEA